MCRGESLDHNQGWLVNGDHLGEHKHLNTFSILKYCTPLPNLNTESLQNQQSLFNTPHYKLYHHTMNDGFRCSCVIRFRCFFLV